MGVDYIKESFIENKKKIYLALVLIVIMIITSVINSLSNNTKLNMKSIMKSFGKDYYEHYYEDKKSGDEDYITQLERVSVIGIRLYLKQIITLYENVDEEDFVNDRLKCDLSRTYVIIYPKSPYGPKDYKMKVKLSC